MGDAAKGSPKAPFDPQRRLGVSVSKVPLHDAGLICPSIPAGFCGKQDHEARPDNRKAQGARGRPAGAGVTHAALFGSVARDEQNAESDIDILVELDPTIVATIFDYAGLKDYIASLFEGSVDVIDREALKPRVRPQAVADAIYAF